MTSQYEPIEPQFDLAAQEARAAASRKPESEPTSSMVEAAQNVGSGGEVPTFGALDEVPEVSGKVDQEPELTAQPEMVVGEPEEQP